MSKLPGTDNHSNLLLSAYYSMKRGIHFQEANIQPLLYTFPIGQKSNIRFVVVFHPANFLIKREKEAESKTSSLWGASSGNTIIAFYEMPCTITRNLSLLYPTGLIWSKPVHKHIHIKSQPFIHHSIKDFILAILKEEYNSFSQLFF